MKNNIKKIILTVLVLIMLFTINGIAAVVTDNDSSGFVTKAEFVAFKENVQAQVDLYNTNLGTALDGAISVYLANMGGKGSANDVLDKLFPIGSILVANQPPTLGTWEEITDAKGRALYFGGSSTAFGDTEDQVLPKFPELVTDEVEHTHTFTGTSGNTSNAGNHTHTVGDWAETAYTKSNSGSVSFGTVTSPPTQGIQMSGSTHTHSVTPAGTLSENSHYHTATLDTSDPVYKTGNTKVQPNAYVIKMWKRTA